MNSLLESTKQIGSFISQYIEQEETNRRLSKPVLNALREIGLHRLFLPKSLGGLETDPVTTATLVEEVASHNTAAGWSMMVANVSTWWCSRLSEEGIRELYKNGDHTLIAGAFHPPMMATVVKGGYSIKGRSPLTSNVHEANWIFVTALIMENEQVKMKEGRPDVIGVFMNAANCQIIDTWFTLGMKASDSNDIEANDVFVPNHLSFALNPDFQPNSFFKGPLYRFSAIGASIACLIAPIALAVARNAIEEVKSLAGKKTSFGTIAPLRERGSIQRKLGIAKALVMSSRAYLYNTLTESWSKCQAGEKLLLDEKADLLLASAHTNQSCLQAVDHMYSAAGTTALYLRNKLAHYFADAQVIRQHGFANDSRYETAAQVYLGLQPDLAVLIF